MAMSAVHADRAPGPEVHTTPQELATELTVLTEVDWRKVWPGAGGGYEPDPAWLAQFDWEVVNFQWRRNDWGPITVQTRTGKRHRLTTTTSHSQTYVYASHRLWTGPEPEDPEGRHDEEAAEAARAWDEYLAAALCVLGEPTWSGAWDSPDFPVGFGRRSGPLDQRRDGNPYRLAVWNPPGPEDAVVTLSVFSDMYGRHSVDLKLRDPAHVVLDDSYREVEAKVGDVGAWGRVPEALRWYGDPEPADKPGTTWQDVAAHLRAISSWDWDAIFGDHTWNRAFTRVDELEVWARRLGWTVSGIDSSDRVSVTTRDGLSLWLPPLLRYPARVNWLESKLWRISSKPSSRNHRNVLDPALTLWEDCMAGARDILGAPGFCGAPDGPDFPPQWHSWGRERLGFKIDTCQLALWPSPGEPAPAIGLFLQGGYMEGRMDREAAQLDLRIWRPATPRTI